MDTPILYSSLIADRYTNNNFKVSSSDPNRFDKDKDGIGCENYW